MILMGQLSFDSNDAVEFASSSSVDGVFDAFDLCRKVSSYPLHVNSNSNSN
jgi:hypothetical protein